MEQLRHPVWETSGIRRALEDFRVIEGVTETAQSGLERWKPGRSRSHLEASAVARCRRSRTGRSDQVQDSLESARVAEAEAPAPIQLPIDEVEHALGCGVAAWVILERRHATSGSNQDPARQARLP
jgi:hypothetical protein